MDRYQKQNKLREAKNQIIKLQTFIDSEIKILNELKKIYEIEAKSEIPFLIYLADESTDVPKYEYLYYLADIDEVISIYEETPDKVLPKSINMLNHFKRPLPQYIWPGDIRQSHYREVEESIQVIKRMINLTFDNNDIQSWTEVRKIINLNINGNSTKHIKLKLVK